MSKEFEVYITGVDSILVEADSEDEAIEKVQKMNIDFDFDISIDTAHEVIEYD